MLEEYIYCIKGPENLLMPMSTTMSVSDTSYDGFLCLWFSHYSSQSG